VAPQADFQAALQADFPVALRADFPVAPQADFPVTPQADFQAALKEQHPNHPRRHSRRKKHWAFPPKPSIRAVSASV
jgi:hypothetical protein